MEVTEKSMINNGNHESNEKGNNGDIIMKNKEESWEIMELIKNRGNNR